MIYEEDEAIIDEGVQITGAVPVTIYLDAKYPFAPLLNLDLALRFKQLDLMRRILASDGAVLADNYEFRSKYSQGATPCCVDFALYVVVPHTHPKWAGFIATMNELIYGNV